MKNLSISLLVVTLAACGQNGEDKVTALETEVLSIHDEVMPKMDSIMLLKSGLTKKIQEIDSLDNLGMSSTTMAEQRIKAIDLSQKLSDTDMRMMNWMHGYKGDSAKKLDAADAARYFESERDKILEVKQLTNKSLSEAASFLQ